MVLVFLLVVGSKEVCAVVLMVVCGCIVVLCFYLVMVGHLSNFVGMECAVVVGVTIVILVVVVVVVLE